MALFFNLQNNLVLIILMADRFFLLICNPNAYDKLVGHRFGTILAQLAFFKCFFLFL